MKQSCTGIAIENISAFKICKPKWFYQSLPNKLPHLNYYKQKNSIYYKNHFNFKISSIFKWLIQGQMLSVSPNTEYIVLFYPSKFVYITYIDSINCRYLPLIILYPTVHSVFYHVNMRMHYLYFVYAAALSCSPYFVSLQHELEQPGI